MKKVLTGSKLLNRKWVEKDKEIHKQKLKTVKSSIDIRSPQFFSHLRTKPKKGQMLEERYSQIEKENRMLLDKMTKIMKNRTV
jgi:hypothetical protein